MNLGPLTHLDVCQRRDPPPGRALPSWLPLAGPAGPGGSWTHARGALEAVGVALLAELAEKNNVLFLRESAEHFTALPPVGQAIFTT